jgi:mannitol-1-phosphate/altronate dehydrogenase
MRWQRGVDENGTTYEVDDPLAVLTKPAWNHSSTEDIVGQHLAIKQIFPTDLAADDRFRNSVCAALHSLITRGAEATVRQLVAVDAQHNLQ